MSYASLIELRQFLGVTDDAKDVDRQRALDAATEAINDMCGRTFGVDATDQTKYFYPNVDGIVDVVDLVTLTTLKVDTSGNRTYATTLATTDYELLPYNETRYQQIKIWPTSSRSFGDARLVQVVGKFGYAISGQVPNKIKQACLILANRYSQRAQNPFGILQSPDLGQYTRISAEDPDVKALLAPYVRKNTWVMV